MYDGPEWLSEMRGKGHAEQGHFPWLKMVAGALKTNLEIIYYYRPSAMCTKNGLQV